MEGEQPVSLELVEGQSVHPDAAPERKRTPIETFQRNIRTATEHLDTGDLNGALYASGDAVLALRSAAAPEDKIAQTHLSAGMEFHQSIRARLEQSRAA